jgi:hypothetical protein
VQDFRGLAFRRLPGDFSVQATAVDSVQSLLQFLKGAIIIATGKRVTFLLSSYKGGIQVPREAGLFDESEGSVLRAYLLLKNGGSANIPPNWIERAKVSRKNREESVAKALKSGKIKDILLIEQWELAYRKECFYRGLRVLLELEREGQSSI